MHFVIPGEVYKNHEPQTSHPKSVRKYFNNTSGYWVIYSFYHIQYRGSLSLYYTTVVLSADGIAVANQYERSKPKPPFRQYKHHSASVSAFVGSRAPVFKVSTENPVDEVIKFASTSPDSTILSSDPVQTGHTTTVATIE